MTAVRQELCIDQREGDGWMLYLGDSCEVVKGLPDDSVDFGIHSPPFANLYIYSDSESDLGNCADTDEFFDHYRYLIPELLRTTVPGRLCAVHCKDLPRYTNRDGAAGLIDFPGMIRQAFEDCGWVFHSRVTVWKCPVTEMQRTKCQGLLHKQVCGDSAYSRQGMADYLLVFRKWDGRDAATGFPKPVRSPDADYKTARFDSYVGSMPPGSRLQWRAEGDGEVLVEIDRPLAPPAGRRSYSIEVWQRYASPVWFDINQMDVLNVKQARDSQDDKHICPLQLGLIERAVHLWSNPGDVVFSPFAGIGSEGVGAIRQGRKFVGVELKPGYFKAACRNLKVAANTAAASRKSLFPAAGGPDR